MVAIRGHGGGCCGINHILGFGAMTTANDIRRCIEGTRQFETRGMLVEAVLTNG